MIAADEHSAVVEALEANQWAFLRAISDRGGAEVSDDGEVFWIVTGVPVAPFNGVVRTTVPPDRADATIDQVAATLDSREAPWSWYVGPATLPVDLADRLGAKGFGRLEVLPGMAAPIPAPSEPSAAGRPPAAGRFRFEQVREEPSLEAFGTLLGLAFEMPPAVVEPFLRLLDVGASGDEPALRNFVALDGSEPVACGSLVVAEGVAGLYNIGVPPERQRQGIGTAMTAALMAEGHASGARTAVLWASAAGVPGYRRLGFEERCRLTLYTRG